MLPLSAMAQDSLKVMQLDAVHIVTAPFLTSKVNKLDVPVKWLPVSMSRVSPRQLQLLGTDEMAGALQYVSGVRPVTTYGGFQQFNMRGFADFLLMTDGFRDERSNAAASAPLTNLAGVESIEVLKGPGSVLTGHSAVGGIINVIRKQPSDTALLEAGVAFGSFASKRVRVGAGGALSKQLSYRLDVGVSDEDGWRGAGSSRNSVYFALGWNPSEKDRFTLQLGANKDRYDSDAGIPTHKGAVLPGIAAKTRYNSLQDEMTNERFDIQLQYDRKISSHLSLTNRIAFSADDIVHKAAEGMAINATLDSVSRKFLQFNHKTMPLQNMLDLNWRFKTGRVAHRLVTGWSFNLLKRQTQFDRHYRSQSAHSVSLYNPVDIQGALPVNNTDRTNINEIMNGIYLQDWMDISPKLKALAAVRFDHFNGRYRPDDLVAGTSGVTTQRNVSVATYRAGLVYEAFRFMSVYGSWSNYFRPARQIAAAKEVNLDPETGYQYEGGVRFTHADRISLNVAGFYLKKNDIIVNLGGGNFDRGSEADSRGVEVDLQTKLAPNWSLQSNYTYTDAKYKKYTAASQGGKDLSGRQLVFAPKHQYSLISSYDWKKLTFMLSGYGMSDNYADAANTVKLDGYFILNAGLSYQMNKVRIGANVNNMLDRRGYYTAASYSTQLYSGMPLNYLLSLQYKM